MFVYPDFFDLWVVIAHYRRRKINMQSTGRLLMGLLPILAQYFSTGADLEIAFQMQVEICEFPSIMSILHKQSFAVGAFALCLSHTSCTIRFFIWEPLLGVLSSVPTFGEVKIAWYCHVPIVFFLYLFSFNLFSPFSMSVEHCLSGELISFLSRLQEPKVWCVLCCPLCPAPCRLSWGSSGSQSHTASA